MKAEQLNDSVTLYEGDCLEVLPTLTGIDAVVTDPPYGLGDKWQGGGGSRLSSWGFSPTEAMEWDGTTCDPAVMELLTLNVPTLIWGGNYYPLPSSRCWFVWDKKQPDTWTTGQAEMAWSNIDRPIRVYRLAQCEQANEGEKYHPTQKPLSLMAWCICMMRLPQDCTILDPFAGSGTTGIAAMLEGRKAILIEKDPKYCDVIRRRVERFDCQQPGSLFRTQQPALC